MKLPPIAARLAAAGAGLDALGLLLRLSAEQTQSDTDRVALLEQAFVLGQPSAALSLSIEWFRGSEANRNVRAYAMALAAAERGVPLGDIVAMDVAIAASSPGSPPQQSMARAYAGLPDFISGGSDPAVSLITGLRLGTADALGRASAMKFDVQHLPSPSYQLCSILHKGDTSVFDELGRRAADQDMVADLCFVEAVLSGGKPIGAADAAAWPRPLLGWLVERVARGALQPAQEGEASYLIGHWLAVGSLGGQKPAEAAIWFLRAGQMAPLNAPIPNELPPAGRYADAIAALPKVIRTPVVASLEPLRARIFPDTAPPPPDPSRRAFVGLKIHKIGDTLSRELGMSGPEGVVVDGYSAGSPARASGVEIGDVITSFDNKPAATTKEFVDSVASAEPGHDYPVVVIRGGERISISVRPATPPHD